MPLIVKSFIGNRSISRLYRGSKLLFESMFDPLSIPWHTALWADDITGVTNGGKVSAWEDSMGSGRTTEGLLSTAPTWIESNSELNGKASVHFNGSQWCTISFGETLSSNRETFLVVSYDFVASSGNKYMVEGGTSTSNQRNGLLTLSSKYTVIMKNVSDYQSMPVGNPGPMAARWNNVEHQFNKELYTQNLGDNTQNLATLGSYIQTSTTYGATGSIAFYGVIDRHLTVDEKTSIHQWAIDYYGTPS